MHDGGEGDLGGLSSGAQALVVGFNERVVQGGAERGHGEGFARGSPAAADVSLSTDGAAVRVHGGNACEGSDGSTRRLAKFGQVGQKRVGADGSDARYLG